MKILTTNYPYPDRDYGNILSRAKLRKALDLLEESTTFEEGILKLRKNFNITEQWFNSKLLPPKLFDREYGKKISFKMWSEYCDGCLDLTRKLNLRKSWYYSILWFVMYDVFPPIYAPEILPIPGDQFQLVDPHPDDEEEYTTKTLHLIIQDKLSKAELHNLIDKQWSEIEVGLSGISDTPSHYWKRSSLAKRVVILRDGSKRLSFGKIAEVLAKDYEDDVDLYDLLTEDYVKNLYHRWKKRVSVVEGIS